MGKFNLKHKISIKRKKGILSGDIYNDYDISVYIKGDFTASLAEAQSLAQEYGRDDFYVVSPNDDYGFFTNNCDYVTNDLFLMGTLPDGTLVKDYVDIKAAEEKN